MIIRLYLEIKVRLNEIVSLMYGMNKTFNIVIR